MRKLLFIVSWFLLSNWGWDVAHLSYFQSSQIIGSGWLTNGLWVVDSMLVYHLAWYSSIAAFFVLAIYCIRLKENKKEEIK